MSLNHPIHEIITFRVDQMVCGIDISNIQEINKNPLVSPVYRAPEYIHGVLNLRGQIVSVIDLRKKFKLPPKAVSAEMRMIVLRFEGESIGLLVDDVHDVVTVDPHEIENAIADLEGVPKSYFIATYKMQENLVAILNVDEILKTLPNRSD